MPINKNRGVGRPAKALKALEFQKNKFISILDEEYESNLSNNMFQIPDTFDFASVAINDFEISPNNNHAKKFFSPI